MQKAPHSYTGAHSKIWSEIVSPEFLSSLPSPFPPLSLKLSASEFCLRANLYNCNTVKNTEVKTCLRAIEDWISYFTFVE